jgi:prolyl-tRNA synthetase
MRLSKLLIPTLREVPAEAEVISHQLMLRAGLIRKLAAGIYNYLPLGWRILRKVENIVREEMDRAGALELMMPAAVPAELWQESGRWEKYGKELLRFHDRKNAEFCIGPTHEEVITDIIRNNIRSYKELPKNLYQIQTKFRDEIRPRFGLMRGREFIMKDAYSFHDTQESLDKEYQNMYQTYCRIFERCGLKYKVVKADSGNIGGSVSQEFMVLAETGEDLLLSCDSCDYSANIEAAASHFPVAQGDHSFPASQGKGIEEVYTPNKKSIEDVSEFLKAKPEQLIKTLVYWFKKDEKEQLVVALLPGDRQINEIKLKNYLGADWVMLARDEDVVKALGVEPGFCGPVGVKGQRIVVDNLVLGIPDGITGANKKDYHLINVVPGRDFEIKEKADISIARAGDVCPVCGKGKLTEIRGIEVGHIFKLGTKYSQAMKANFLDKDGKEKPFIMGCYGIGIGRTAAAAIEQNNDEKGIVWPLALAPYQVVVIPANIKEKEQYETAENIYNELRAAGIDAVFDDRDERMGVKLNDMELIGIYSRVVVGKSLAQGQVEFRLRAEKDNQLIDKNKIIDHVVSKLKG